MKKKLYGGLTAVLALCLTFTLAGCKDDKESSEEEKQQQADEQADQDMADAATFWNVVGQLSDTPMPDDWQNATYEPAIGEPDGGNTAVRIVSCADAESAAERAADLLGGNITESTQDYTYQNDIVGTLTYRKTGGSSLATVDVSIKQMPGLSQIIYKTPEQIGQNGSFAGTAYYRFGDVVTKTNKDGDLDYWVCIRPSFGPAGKGDSHWISVSKLPTENLKKQDKTVNGQKLTHVMPKGLCTTQEYMVDLAEVLYAMTDPEQWARNLIINDGYKTLKYLWDFDFKKRYEYHDFLYFSKLGEEWEKYGYFKKIFGLTREEMRQHLKANGLSMVYNQASISGSDITLNVVRYDGMNLKTKHEFKSTGRWESRAFNINELMAKGYIDDQLVAGPDDRCWVVRYASGATLAKGDEPGGYDKYKALPNCYDIFLYNQMVSGHNMDAATLQNTAPESALDGKCNEHGYYLTGDVLMDINGCRWICVQGTPLEMHKEDLTGKNYDYAYFVSYDREAVGDQLKNVPKKNLAMQILFAMEIFFHDALMSWNSNSGTDPKAIQKNNIKRYADVDFGEIFAVRDTFRTFTVVAPGHVMNNYASTVYKDTDGKLCVLRLVADYTVENSEGDRLWSWKYYDTYSKDLKTRMLLSDLADQNKVNNFNQDIWVKMPWYDIRQNPYKPVVTATTGPRTDTEDLADLNRLIYQRGRHFIEADGNGELVPFDMYRDPLVPFAVKRVKDTKQPAEKFDDGTVFYHWSRLYNLSHDLFGSYYLFATVPYDKYEAEEYRPYRMLNDKLYNWGMANPVK